VITYGIPGAFAALAVIGLAVTWCIMRDGEAPRSRARQRAGSVRSRVRAIAAGSSSWGRAAMNLVPGAGLILSPGYNSRPAQSADIQMKADSPAPENTSARTETPANSSAQWWLTDAERAAGEARASRPWEYQTGEWPLKVLAGGL
jgi:hypothetical protein